VVEVGVKFQAHWDADGKWYTVTIKAHDEVKGKTTIKYSDRKTESIIVGVLPSSSLPLPFSFSWTCPRPPWPS